MLRKKVEIVIMIADVLVLFVYCAWKLGWGLFLFVHFYFSHKNVNSVLISHCFVLCDWLFLW